MLEAQRLEEQIKAEEEAAEDSEELLRTRYVAWSTDKNNLRLKKDLAVVLCRGADVMDKQLAVSYLRECWEGGESVQECLFAATITLYALQEWEEAMQLCNELISHNPDSSQIRSIHRAIKYRLEEKLSRNLEQGQKTMAAVGVGVIVAATAFFVAKALVGKSNGRR